MVQTSIDFVGGMDKKINFAECYDDELLQDVRMGWRSQGLCTNSGWDLRSGV